MSETIEHSNIPTTIAAFRADYKLVAIFKSINEAARMVGVVRQSLIKAAYGETISAMGYYWRAVPSDFEIEPDDIGELTVLEFDEAIGVDRRIYPTKHMARRSSMLESEYVKLNRKQNK